MIIDCNEITITIDRNDWKEKHNSFEYWNQELYWLWDTREEAIQEFNKWLERYIRNLQKLLYYNPSPCANTPKQ